MEFNQNRLQFVHCDHIFENFDEIKSFVIGIQAERPSLYSEPMIFEYKNVTEEDNSGIKEPHVVLAIGSVGDGKFHYDPETGEALNKTYFIDMSQVQRDIAKLQEDVKLNKEEIEKLKTLVNNIREACGFDEQGNYVPFIDDKILSKATNLTVADKLLSEYILDLEKRYSLSVEDTETIDMTLIKSADGQVLKSDVKLGSKVFEGKVVENIIVQRPDGIFTNVDMNYDADENKLVFIVNGGDSSEQGLVKEFNLPKETYLTSGRYDTASESLILSLNRDVMINGVVGKDIKIDMTQLIHEWTTEIDPSSPVVLTIEHVGSEDTEHEGIKNWQSILKADVRILDAMPSNILKKTEDGKFLYVKGVAENIKYTNTDGKEINVKEALDAAYTKTSSRQDNIISIVKDGLFGTVDMGYDTYTNEIKLYVSDNQGNVDYNAPKKSIKLNSVEFITNAYYDAKNEEIVIQYRVNNEYKEIRIPLQGVFNQFIVDNSMMNVTLTLNRVLGKNDTLSANVNISKDESNILKDVGHTLYVDGRATNIKMVDKRFGETVESSFSAIVKEMVDRFAEEKAARENADDALNEKILQEKERAENAEQTLSDALKEEKTRAEKAETTLRNDLDNEIKRSTQKDEELSNKLDVEIKRSNDEDVALKENLEKAKKELSFIVEDSGTIDLTKTDSENGSIVKANVKISSNSTNMINTNGEPLFVNMDILYDEMNNELILKRSGLSDKKIQLNAGSIVDRIYYDYENKQIVIVYEDSNNKKHEVRINVSEFLDKWDVQKTHEGAVELEKRDNYDGNGTDLLLARIIISENKNNLLKNEAGSLFVSNSSSDIMFDEKNSVYDVIVEFNNKDAELLKKIEDEVTRATISENNLDKALKDETSRAKSSEESLKISIDGETSRAKDKEAIIESKVDSEIKRSTEKDTELEKYIKEVEVKSNLLVSDTDTINLERVATKEGVVISGNVKVSTVYDNLINVDGKSLYSSVDLEYNEFNNILTLKRSGANNIDKHIQFNKGTIINNVEYNNPTKELVIVYTDAIGEERLIRVNLSELYNEFDVAQDHMGAVQLSKTPDYDNLKTSLLKASVVLSSSPRNSIVNDKGSLFVPNTATDYFMSDGKSVESAIVELKNADNDLSHKIEEESNKAESTAKDLKALIEAEKNRAEKVETVLRADIDNTSSNLEREIKRAQEQESVLADDIKKETDRAIAADDELRNMVTTEMARATDAESKLKVDITKEEERAMLAEKDLSSKLENVSQTAEQNKSDISNITANLDKISKDYAMTVEDTETVDMTKTALESGGYQIKGDVKVSLEKDNLIIKNSDGLFSNVNLDYDVASNKIRFTTNGIVKEVQLNSVSTINDIDYDARTREIVIKYVANGVEIKEVRVPAEDLFRPIEADNNGNNVVVKVDDGNSKITVSSNLYFKDNIDNTESTVKLEATQNNKLKANVNISTRDKNILKSDANNHLYVDGEASNIIIGDTSLGHTVEDALHDIDGRLDKLENQLDGDIIGSIGQDIIDLQNKTNIQIVDTASIDLYYTHTKSSSSMEANVIMSTDIHQLLKVLDDGHKHDTDNHGNYIDKTVRNGLLFDGNIDYLTFEYSPATGKTEFIPDEQGVIQSVNKKWSRYLQNKRNSIKTELHKSKRAATDRLNEASFLQDKKDGEMLLSRYDDGKGIKLVIGYVYDEGVKKVTTLDTSGPVISNLNYTPKQILITTTNSSGKTETHEIKAESLYFTYSDISGENHVLQTSFKNLIEETIYPESVSKFDGTLGRNDGLSVKEHHNVKFDWERHVGEENVSGKTSWNSVMKADVDYYDCGEYTDEQGQWLLG